MLSFTARVTLDGCMSQSLGVTAVCTVGNATGMQRYARYYSSIAERQIAYRRSVSSRAIKEKPFYVTTPIFYVNAKPHIGHLYTNVLSDCLARFERMKGREVRLLTGTDEHGMKVEAAAKTAGLEPKEFCDKTSLIFRKLAEAADCKIDRFIRTTDEDHIRAVTFLWKQLEYRGYIYKGKHQGWYSTSDECFYPENAVTKLEDKSLESGSKWISNETGSTVEWTEEENYMFRLSSLQKDLLKFYLQNKEVVYPQKYYSMIISKLQEGVRDLSISRPRNRIAWGIPVPGDPGHCIYVWVDALVNYLTMAGFPWNLSFSEYDPKTVSMNEWPADRHIIGKDILKFHAIYWPAFLLAADLTLPRQIVVHSHWTVDGLKMSKSKGNGIDPFELFETFGCDPIRFHLMHHGRLSDDTNFSINNVREEYISILQNQIGNLLQRILTPKILIDGIPAVLEYASKNLTNTKEPRLLEIDTLSNRCQQYMKNSEVWKYIDDILRAIASANKLFADEMPWALSRLISQNRSKKDTSLSSETTLALKKLYRTSFEVLETLRISAILLQPIMPSKSKILLDKLAVQADRRDLKFASLASDFSYGRSALDRNYSDYVFGPLLEIEASLKL